AAGRAAEAAEEIADAAQFRARVHHEVAGADAAAVNRERAVDDMDGTRVRAVVRKRHAEAGCPHACLRQGAASLQVEGFAGVGAEEAKAAIEARFSQEA